ncbi:hypothetical protein QPK87_33495 [Kamptonema cortianum]|nr:hypothetical protein [Kamptonema cortianum]
MAPVSFTARYRRGRGIPLPLRVERHSAMMGGMGVIILVGLLVAVVWLRWLVTLAALV